MGIEKWPSPGYTICSRRVFRNKIPLKWARWFGLKWLCHATMAFKQVKTRAALFRPWDIDTQVDPLTQKQTDKQSDEGNQLEGNTLTVPCQSSSNLGLPSAFRTPSMIARTVPVADSSSYGMPQLLSGIQDLPRQLPSVEALSILPEMKLNPNSVGCWGIAPDEMPFQVNPAFGQLLEQPNMSKFRVKKQRPKRFRCKQCQTSFSNNGQLKGHLRIHSGERPFACDHKNCGKQFTRNEELTRHKRIHTGVRPHPCILCGKRFGRKDHLKKHVKTHQRTNVVRMPVSAFQGLSYFVSDCIPWY